jgi:hypothetical protein
MSVLFFEIKPLPFATSQQPLGIEHLDNKVSLSPHSIFSHMLLGYQKEGGKKMRRLLNRIVCQTGVKILRIGFAS